MGVKFRDYYEVLGVDRDATEEQVRKAYRQKARKLHPDVSKADDAEKRFQQLSEAYEVLMDPDKRAKYDRLGQHWRDGQEFRPPPGAGVQFDFDGPGMEGFSDFFSALFGERAHAGGFGPRHGPRPRRARRGPDYEAELPLTLEDLAHGGSKSLQLSHADGPRTYDVKLPPGLQDGSRIRLGGQGGPGVGQGAAAGDLLLRVKLLPHARFSSEGAGDLRTIVQLTPWEAVLGTQLDLQTLTGSVTLRIRPGSSGGQVLRLTGQGLPRPGGSRGDLLAVLRIVVPPEPSEAERKLFEQLRDASSFTPETRCRRP